MPGPCELTDVRGTLETWGEGGVTALRAANAVKDYKAGEGRDKELIDQRISGGFGSEIRDKASLVKVTDTEFQLPCGLIS